MPVSLGRAAGICLIAAPGVATAPVRKIQYTDTKLKNGLRVIISEDHAAPVLPIVVNYNVVGLREDTRSLEITKENLENQRNAVQEERRLSVDNQPYGKTFETHELAYENFA